MDATFQEEAPTPPMGLSLSDRMILEHAIRGLHKVIERYIEEQREQAAKFYTTRMMPLEAQVVKLTTIAWFAMGIAASALFVGAVLIVALAAR